MILSFSLNLVIWISSQWFCFYKINWNKGQVKRRLSLIWIRMRNQRLMKEYWWNWKLWRRKMTFWGIRTSNWRNHWQINKKKKLIWRIRRMCFKLIMWNWRIGFEGMKRLWRVMILIIGTVKWGEWIRILLKGHLCNKGVLWWAIWGFRMELFKWRKVELMERYFRLLSQE